MKSTHDIHISFLQLLEDFDEAGRYSWGSACLEYLYRYLCRSTMISSVMIGGFMWLIETWAYMRIPTLRPPLTKFYLSFPIANRLIFLDLKYLRVILFNIINTL